VGDSGTATELVVRVSGRSDTSAAPVRGFIGVRMITLRTANLEDAFIDQIVSDGPSQLARNTCR